MRLTLTQTREQAVPQHVSGASTITRVSVHRTHGLVRAVLLHEPLDTTITAHHSHRNPSQPLLSAGR